MSGARPGLGLLDSTSEFAGICWNSSLPSTIYLAGVLVFMLILGLEDYILERHESHNAVVNQKVAAAAAGAGCWDSGSFVAMCRASSSTAYLRPPPPFSHVPPFTVD